MDITLLMIRTITAQSSACRAWDIIRLQWRRVPDGSGRCWSGDLGIIGIAGTPSTRQLVTPAPD